MSLKEKLLILWILCSMLVAFIISHIVSFVVAGIENSCAFIPAVAVKVAAAVFSCWHSY